MTRKQLLLGAALLTLAGGASLGLAQSQTKSQAPGKAEYEAAEALAMKGGSPRDSEVAARLKERLPRTSVSKINCQLVDGLCEVTAGSQLFYVDQSARYLVIGRLYDMQTRQDLTAARLLEVNPDMLVGGAASQREADLQKTTAQGVNAPPRNAVPRTMSLAALPPAGGIVWGNPKGQSVTFFSDFRCGYCKAMAASLETLGVRVVERPISILGSRALADQVFCARDRHRAVKQAYAGEDVSETKACDTSPLDANERFARDAGIAGTPVLVRADGAVLEGFRPKEVLVSWLKGGKS